MNYKLIHNQHELQKFIDFLPELKENEGYFLILIARAKFAKNVIIPSAVKLRRETVNSKDKILQTIKHWEVEEGTYTVTRNNVVTSIPLENIAVYVSYNPKNHLKAAANMAKACIEILAGSRADVNLKSLANDQIQNSNGSKNYVDIDVDVDKTEDYEEIIKFIKNGQIKEALYNSQFFYNIAGEDDDCEYHKGIFYIETEYHDLFRIGGYPDDKLLSYQECLDFIKSYDDKHNCKIKLFYRNGETKSSLQLFWEEHPDGMIRFG